MSQSEPLSPTVPDWHTLELEDVFARLGSSEGGLSADEVRSRQARHGPNRLPRKRPPAAWLFFVRQFRNPLIYILACAALVSFGMGHYTDAGFILGVLCLNALIGGFQELRADKASQALQQLLRTRATVLRGGEVIEIDSEELVPGDAVALESGNRVPADLRLYVTQGVEVDESLLTGESLPVPKDCTWRGPPTSAVGDRMNVAHAGTVVTRGRASGVVVATGTGTALGRVALDVASVEAGKPPLLIRIERFTRVIAAAVLVAAAATAVLGIVRQGSGVGEMFLFAVALAVSAIPEGLPVAMTVALSVATSRMARRGVIVRRLAAVEGLGSCTLIATDKTGTLTCNELTVRRILLGDGTELEVTGGGYQPEGSIQYGDGRSLDGETRAAVERLARAAVLCNEATLHRSDGTWIWRGDPTDVALLALGHKAGRLAEIERAERPQVGRIPFEPELRYAASHHEVDGEVHVFVKGAPERVLAMCRRSIDLVSAQTLATEGFRVLALAEGVVHQPVDVSQVPAEPSDLTFLGFVGMIDPLRPGVREAVAECRAAGIGVTMITGDHPVTALAIAADLDLARSAAEVCSGTEVAEMDEESLAQRIVSTRVFARVSPHQKLRIVQAARHAGHFVAVTGDGVNDAPALREANIGVAMGKGGTDVAREAAELVLVDDNFSTIIAGIEEGRVAYDNIRKVIFLLISTGAAEVVLVLTCLSVGLPLPLLPVQLLWLNLVTNGIQDVALAFEPRESDVLRRKPRSPRERIFNRLMIERTLVSALVMGGLGAWTFHWMIEQGWAVESARNGLLLLMVLFENVHIGNCRSETRSLFRLSPLTSPILLFGAATAFLLHLLSMYVPAATAVLQTEPVQLSTWAMLAGLALLLAVAMELHKWSWRRRAQRGQASVVG